MNIFLNFRNQSMRKRPWMSFVGSKGEMRGKKEETELGCARTLAMKSWIKSRTTKMLGREA